MAVVAQQLGEYNAKMVARGQVDAGPVAVFVDEDGDWMVLVVPTGQNQMACLLAAGGAWEKVGEAPPIVKRAPETPL